MGLQMETQKFNIVRLSVVSIMALVCLVGIERATAQSSGLNSIEGNPIQACDGGVCGSGGWPIFRFHHKL